MAAQGQMIDLVAPGFRGINSAQAGSVLPPVFATEAQNCLLDSVGRLAARNGYSSQTTTAIAATENIKALHEYRKGDGTRSLICAWDGGIADDISDPDSNDISGAVTVASGDWWFQNFNDKVIGFIDGQQPIVWSGTGNFATISEVGGPNMPTVSGGVGLCAYGRVWAVDSDGVTVRYSGLLDETDWSTSSAGSIDFSNIWTAGTDTITAIAAFNASLVVFGKNHIVFITDGSGSEIGVDPNNIYVSDIITGTGCMSQWSIQPVGESDLVFLSRNGIQSLARLVIDKSNPVTNQSLKVRTELMNDARAETATNIRSFFSPELGIYGITFPTSSRTWVLDQRYKYIDEERNELAPVTKWTLAPTAWCVRDNENILLGVYQEVGLYGGDSDDGTSFRFIWQSPWLNFGENLNNRLKILKRISAILFVQDSADVLFKWGADFSTMQKSRSVTLQGDGGAEFGVAEFGIAEFSGGLSLRIIKINASDSAQYFRFAIEGDITGTFALQQLELFAKIGRLA